MRIYPLIRPFGWLWEHSTVPVYKREPEKAARTGQRALRATCLRGHPYALDDYTGTRYCRICENARHQKQRAKP